MATFVLIHGAWHGGWCWKLVAPALRRAGHEVYAPSLTGLGERRHLARPDPPGPQLRRHGCDRRRRSDVPAHFASGLPRCLRAAGRQVPAGLRGARARRAHEGGGRAHRYGHAAADVPVGPKTFVYCSSPATGSFDQFAARYRNDPAWRFHELKTGHDAMLLMPGEVTRILLGSVSC